MGRRKTHKEFIKEFYEKNSNAEYIYILSEYNGAKERIKCKCKIDGYEWQPTADGLLRGSGCPKCSGNAPLTNEEFISRINLINKNIIIKSEYKGNKSKVLCECNIHKNEWYSQANHLLEGHGCPICALEKLGEHFIKSHKVFIEEMKTINPFIKIIGEYKGSHIPIECECLIDNNRWFATPTNLLSKKTGCPICNQSIGESYINDFLRLKNILYKPQHRFNDCKFYKTLPFDFYLPHYNCCIEFDGEQHYKIGSFNEELCDFIDRKIRDTVKNIYCENNNIKLIRIPYWEINNIDKIINKELGLE